MSRAVAFVSLALISCAASSCGESSSVADFTSTTSSPAMASSSSVSPSSSPSSSVAVSSTIASTSTVVLPDVRELRVPIVRGQLRTTPGDVLAVHADGDLWLHRRLLTASPGSAERLVDLDDPRVVVQEGPGANRVDRAVGPIDGVVYFTDCCEPVSGDLYAVGRAGVERRSLQSLSPGDRVAARPDAGAIALVNSFGFWVIELPSGRTSFEQFEAPVSQLGGGWDVLWASDGRSILVLDAASDWLDVLRFDASAPFALEMRVRVPTIGRTPRSVVQFAGRGPNGEIVVAVERDDHTSLQVLDGSTLAERPDLDTRLPARATAVQLSADGRSMLWIVGETLWYRPAGGPDRVLGADFAAAWFAGE